MLLRLGLVLLLAVFSQDEAPLANEARVLHPGARRGELSENRQARIYLRPKLRNVIHGRPDANSSLQIFKGKSEFLLMIPKLEAYNVAVPLTDQQFIRQGVETRVINGEDAARGQFPYMVGMFRDHFGFCGGALISSQWILTAAHCVENTTVVTAFLGALDIIRPSEHGRLSFNTRKHYKHEGYVRKTSANDIGVVQLPIEVQPNDKIGYISLPPRSFNNRDFVGEELRFSGWGKLTDKSKDLSNRLQFVDLTVIDNALCKHAFGGIITEYIVCAHNYKASTCYLDGGGPMAYTEKSTNKTVHFGLAAFVGLNACSETPTGCPRTYKYLDWISAKTKLPIED